MTPLEIIILLISFLSLLMQTPYFGSYEFRGFSFEFLRHLAVPQEVLNTRVQLSNSGTIHFCKEIWSGAQLNLTVRLVLSESSESRVKWLYWFKLNCISLI